MQIASVLNPVYMPAPADQQPQGFLRLQSETPANPYNSQVDGFVTRTLFGGIAGKNMTKLVFAGGDAASQGLDAITKNAYVRQAGLNAATGAGLFAGLSVLKQGWGMATGKQDGRGAIANILADSLRGGATGLGATAGGGLTAFAMRTMGATGFFGTAMTFIGGAMGGTIASNLVESTGVRNKLLTALGSEKIQPAPTPAT
ncbi:MAG: hypothetical protein ACO1RX_14605 [Candidatus Sericytochromatia bacterium]